MRAIPKSSDREMGNEMVTVYKRDQEEVIKKSSHRKVKIILIIIIFFFISLSHWCSFIHYLFKKRKFQGGWRCFIKKKSNIFFYSNR